MKAGKLRHYVDIHTDVTNGVSDRGEPKTYTIITWRSIPAAILDLSGKEAENARQLVSTANYKIIIRYLEDIKETDRIIWGSRTFQIGHIANPEQKNLELILLCSEVKNVS